MRNLKLEGLNLGLTFDASRNPVASPLLKPVECSFQVKERLLVGFAGEWAGLEGPQSINADRNECFLGHSVNASFFDRPVLKADKAGVP